MRQACRAVPGPAAELENVLSFRHPKLGMNPWAKTPWQWVDDRVGGEAYSAQRDLPIRSTAHRCRPRPGCVEGPVESIEDQVEPEQVLVPVVVAGLKGVLHGHLGEVGILVG